MYFEILNIRKFYYFIFISLVSIFFTYFIRSVFVSESVYINTYAETMTYDRIKEIFNLTKSYELIAYSLFPVFLIIKVMYNTFIVTTATLLENKEEFTFSKNFNVCLKAEFVFVAMNICKIFAFLFFKKITVLGDIDFTPLSLLNFFNPAAIPKWCVYPLQTFSIWEILYCYAGTILFAKTYNISIKKAINIFCIPYITGVFILLLVATFLTLQLS